MHHSTTIYPIRGGGGGLWGVGVVGEDSSIISQKAGYAKLALNQDSWHRITQKQDIIAG
jgi:hypothetical protein